MTDDSVNNYAAKVGYSEKELELFAEGGHRTRHVRQLSRQAPLYSIVARVVSSRHCNSGHTVGQELVLDADGNFITKLCPKRICVYLASQLTIPVALVNERLSEGLAPGDFHFMRRLTCPDVGVESCGYGQVMIEVTVQPRHGSKPGGNT